MLASDGTQMWLMVNFCLHVRNPELLWGYTAPFPAQQWPEVLLTAHVKIVPRGANLTYLPEYATVKNDAVGRYTDTLPLPLSY
jgi:hypothetical protein